MESTLTPLPGCPKDGVHFYVWMRRIFPGIPFERYADDVICHCCSEKQARFVWMSIESRLAACRLELNVQKTKIVYCQSTQRPGAYPNVSFDFLGFTFRPRRAKGRLGPFVAFSPGVSRAAVNSMQREVCAWRLARCTDRSLEDLAAWVNPIIRGWIQYYGQYSKSALYPFLDRFNRRLVKWARRTYRLSHTRARGWLARIAGRQRHLFVHWGLVLPTTG